MTEQPPDAIPERRYVVEVTAPLPSGRVRFVAAEAAARLNLPVEKLIGLLENRVGPVTKPLALASAERVAEVLDRAGAEVALRGEEEPDLASADAPVAPAGHTPAEAPPTADATGEGTPAGNVPSDDAAADAPRQDVAGGDPGDHATGAGEVAAPADDDRAAGSDETPPSGRKRDQTAWSAVEGQFSPADDADEVMLGSWTGGWRERAHAATTDEQDVVTPGSAPGGQGSWPGGGVLDVEAGHRSSDGARQDAPSWAGVDAQDAPAEDAPLGDAHRSWDPLDSGEAAGDVRSSEDRAAVRPGVDGERREDVARDDPEAAGQREEAARAAWPRDDRFEEEDEDDLEDAFPVYGYGARDPFEEGRRQEVAQRRWFLAGALIVSLLVFLALQWAYSDRSVEAAAPPPYQRGLHAYRDGAFVSAARAWRPRAEAGDARAMFMLGYMAEMGQGRAWSNAEAASWYREAAERGLAPAQSRLASLHLRGLGVTRSRSAALRWYEEAARSGDTRAQLEAGRLLFADRQFDRALAWFAAAAPREQEAAAYLAFMGDEGSVDDASR